MTVEHPSVLLKQIMHDNSYTEERLAEIVWINKFEMRNIISKRYWVGKINGAKLEKALGIPKEIFTAWSVANKKKKTKAKRTEIKKKEAENKPTTYAEHLEKSNKMHWMSKTDNKKDVKINLRAFKWQHIY